ncbi:hypothetical protein NBRC116598_05710 [Pseudophaeobacter arcticus]|uniref:Uncharacterized protein n=1 Tax=Pseudophaeobacter arcticus TaxID=385492 RepID=A0ABQ0AGW9_9RHOB
MLKQTVGPQPAKDGSFFDQTGSGCGTGPKRLSTRLNLLKGRIGIKALYLGPHF